MHLRVPQYFVVVRASLSPWGTFSKHAKRVLASKVAAAVEILLNCHWHPPYLTRHRKPSVLPSLLNAFPKSSERDLPLDMQLLAMPFKSEIRASQQTDSRHMQFNAVPDRLPPYQDSCVVFANHSAQTPRPRRARSPYLVLRPQ